MCDKRCYSIHKKVELLFVLKWKWNFIVWRVCTNLTNDLVTSTQQLQCHLGFKRPKFQCVKRRQTPLNLKKKITKLAALIAAWSGTVGRNQYGRDQSSGISRCMRVHQSRSNQFCMSAKIRELWRCPQEAQWIWSMFSINDFWFSNCEEN